MAGIRGRRTAGSQGTKKIGRARAPAGPSAIQAGILFSVSSVIDTPGYDDLVTPNRLLHISLDQGGARVKAARMSGSQCDPCSRPFAAAA